MEVELLINIIILCTVGLFCIIVIAVRVYVSCFRPQSEASELYDIHEIVPPEIEVKEEDLQWVIDEKQLNKKQVCSICLDRRVNAVTNCKHSFHMNCLIEWKKRMKKACPYCKSEELDKIKFYCHHCTKSNFTYLFNPPLQRSHMVPPFFIEFLANQKRLLCNHCKETNTQAYQECITRNFSSVKDAVTIHNSNKTSRNMAEIEIRTPKQSRQVHQQRDTASSPNEMMGPSTDNRMITAIDY